MPRPHLELTVGELLDRLASDEGAATGGGSAAALTVALAAGLTAMVARRSRDSWPEAAGVAAQALTLQARAAPLVQSDAEAWAEALQALDERSAGLEEKLARAAGVPLRIGDLAADVAALAALTAERGEGTYRADAAAAAVLAAAAARIAEKLVAINLSITEGDERRLRGRLSADAAAEAAGRALDSGP
jgi:formiminotetrahydrofolate cyclodeaminase